MVTSTHEIGLAQAIDVARRAACDVPAYRSHLRRHGIDPDVAYLDDSFHRLPEITRSGYLKRYPREQLVWHGDVTEVGTWSASSGSSGTPSYWGREQVALDESADMFDHIFRRNFMSHERTTLVINCFAMGTWIGGTYTYLALLALRERGHRLSVITPGIATDAVIDALAELGPHYTQIVLAGYPPFIKDVLDRAEEQARAQDIHLLLAGEAITENWRDHVLDRLGKVDDTEAICLMYGTADAGVMGCETPLTVAIRRAAQIDPQLRDELFGAENVTLPTFVEYDPTRRFVEVVDGYLLFTVDSAMPLIRYRINDTGAILSGQDVRDVLDGHGHPVLAEMINPRSCFIVLTGRPDVAATFYSLNLYPSNIGPAFESSTITGTLTGRYVITTEPDHQLQQVLRIQAELAAGALATEQIRDRLTGLCLSALIESNSEYRELHDRLGQAVEPVVTLRTYRSAGFGDGVKHRYIGRGSK